MDLSLNVRNVVQIDKENGAWFLILILSDRLDILHHQVMLK